MLRFRDKKGIVKEWRVGDPTPEFPHKRIIVELEGWEKTLFRKMVRELSRNKKETVRDDA